MEYLIHLIILISIYGILGLGLNLVVGYTGLLSVAHAAFYGIGAYVTAILTTSFGMNFYLSIILGMILAAAAALLIGLVLSKFKGDYYALVSLGFNIIIFSVFLNWQSITRGPLGIPGIPRPDLPFALISLTFLAVIYFVCHFVVSSSFGRALMAIREDEGAIQVFGYNTHHFKLAIFTISAALAAVAGSLFASYISFIDPSTFSPNESIFILVIIIFGGLADLRGSVMGVIFLILLPELLRFAGFPADIAAQTRQLVYGLILVLLMIYRPRGLMGQYKL